MDGSRVILFYGPMGAGKTGAAEQIWRQWIGQKTLLVPSGDTRNGASAQARGGKRIPGQPVSSVADLVNHVTLGPGQLYWIEEVHMLCRAWGREDVKAFHVFLRMLLRMGAVVVLCGLDFGHQGHEIEPVASLRRESWVAPVRLCGRCSDCPGERASTHSWLVPDLDEPIAGDILREDGTGGEYMSLCSNHFYARLKARVAAKAVDAGAEEGVAICATS